MIEKWLGTQRLRRLQRVWRQGKVTLLCLVLTVVVLRGTIGAGKFGTPEQDIEEIREHFFYSRKRAETHRVLVEVSSSSSKTSSSSTGAGNSNNNNNYETFDFKKIFADEGDEPEENRNKPYSLGPKISDWDEQRRDWLQQNPSFPNFVAANKPRVLLVTGSAPKPCENPVGDHYLLKSIKNKIDYCRIHGIEIFYNMALLDAEMAGFWAKLPLIRKLLLSHPEVEFLWWMDSDAMFTDMVFELPWERYEDYNLVMHGWKEMVYEQKNWIGLNTGSFLIRNSQWALDLLDAWAPMGPKGKIREEAGKVLTRELKDRPAFEADDQSAMVYLLATERERWGGKVYLESGYYLHGYWGILVDRYEEMIENHKPGFGDHRWPLVTHFVGCKPCGKFGDYPVERCLRQMDRAFNFGDNQILQMYGFTHTSLGSRSVKPTRRQTDRPVDVKDEFGLLHPPSKAAKLSTTT
ncbi:Xyloglucan 6-xylosyltransferase 1 [Raphanus sativus]|uniref:xyloglucan 6-xylosyltransferase n=1 Tax=Raphanus sativus TaxID=3726 RepID=A0A6J0NJ96_RAPSA|nr:xyloglucan 6-xylosyltransferase 1 [Raphanus sativus]KAJ4905187.1 Xyloglucan 6-xylosyltransferase 1 [Raphanus sativus]